MKASCRPVPGLVLSKALIAAFERGQRDYLRGENVMRCPYSRLDLEVRWTAGWRFEHDRKVKR